MREYLHSDIDILFYIMFYIIKTMKKHYSLFQHHVCIYDTKNVLIGTWLPQSAICNYTPECVCIIK